MKLLEVMVKTRIRYLFSYFHFRFLQLLFKLCCKRCTIYKDRDLQPRTELGDWVSSILFAIVAATIVHTYFIQPFVIPTSSLEKTLISW